MVRPAVVASAATQIFATDMDSAGCGGTLGEGSTDGIKSKHDSKIRISRSKAHAVCRERGETMKLGLALGYSGARLELPVDLVAFAEKIGFDSVWTAEAYGSDAITPLAYLAAKTDRIRLGTGIMQLAGRPASMFAMQAQTVDALAGGNRVIAGLGVSGPQIVEGWYGQPWGRPYFRLRDYLQIAAKIFVREEPVSHAGSEISLPYTGAGSSGLGKPLRSILHTNPELPIWLGAGGEATTRLAGELCQGLLPLASGELCSQGRVHFGG